MINHEKGDLTWSASPTLRVAVIGDRSSYALNLARSLNRLSNVECAFYGPREGPVGEVKSKVVFSGFPNYQPVWTTRGYFFEIINQLSRDRPDIVHFDFTVTIFGQNYSTSIPLGLLVPILRLLGYRVVTTVHDTVSRNVLWELEGLSEGRRLAFWIGLRAFYLLLGCSSLLIVHLGFQRRILSGVFHLSNRKITVVPFGVAGRNRPPQSSLDQWRCIVEGKKVVLFFGVIAPRKGVEYLIEAFSSIADRFPESLLIIAGPIDRQHRGYLKDALRKGVKLQREGRIVTLDYLEEQDADALLELSEVLVLPYVYSYATPSILYWAMAHHKPVIATKLDAFREELSGYAEELLVDPRNAARLASALHALLSNQDLARQAELFMAQKAAANSWDVVAARLQRLYLGILRRTRVRARSSALQSQRGERAVEESRNETEWNN